jgi:HNH endonuclease
MRTMDLTQVAALVAQAERDAPHIQPVLPELERTIARLMDAVTTESEAEDGNGCTGLPGANGEGEVEQMRHELAGKTVFRGNHFPLPLRPIRPAPEPPTQPFQVLSHLGYDETVPRYWWVNQNQTFRQESTGGYLWSPKRTKSGARIRFYDNMREVSPGDPIYSFFDTKIAALSHAESYCQEAPRPEEFGSAGLQWEDIGWRVDAKYTIMPHPISPKDHKNLLAPLWPEKYSPYRRDGGGNQVYLAEIDGRLAEALNSLLKSNGNTIPDWSGISPDIGLKSDALRQVADDRAERLIRESEITDTEKQTLIQARRGQGLFRERVRQLEKYCRITRVSNSEFLIASHIKPWRDSDNRERLDGENGLLLTPTIDRLFDHGFISFEDSGELIVSPVLRDGITQKLGLPIQGPFNSGGFTAGQKNYLRYHREFILKRAH